MSRMRRVLVLVYVLALSSATAVALASDAGRADIDRAHERFEAFVEVLSTTRSPLDGRVWNADRLALVDHRGERPVSAFVPTGRPRTVEVGRQYHSRNGHRGAGRPARSGVVATRR